MKRIIFRGTVMSIVLYFLSKIGILNFLIDFSLSYNIENNYERMFFRKVGSVLILHINCLLGLFHLYIYKSFSLNYLCFLKKKNKYKFTENLKILFHFYIKKFFCI